MERAIKIAPSLLSADFGKLADEVQSVEAAGADLLHIDVMDGHFVPNITIGPLIVKVVRSKTKLPLDTHLMIENPERFVESFAKAGSDIITIHAEAFYQPPATSHRSQVTRHTLTDAGKSQVKTVIQQIKSLGAKAGISLNPDTPLSAIEGLLDDVDMVLVMSVDPGFGGQTFIPSVIPKIEKLRRSFDGDIEVDGGINAENAPAVLEAGTDILVAGTYIFGSRDYAIAIRKLRRSFSQG